MKISIITTVTNPEERMDPWREAVQNYTDLADEVIVVNGGKDPLFNDVDKVRELMVPWPDEWGWDEFTRHINAGLNFATGDWVLKMDIDQFIHEKDFAEVRETLYRLKDKPVVAFQKMSVYPNKKYFQKNELYMAINKAKFGHQIKFGRTNTYSDLCQPIWVDGVDERGVPFGRSVSYEEMGRCGVTIWNFDYTFRTKELAFELFHKMSLAHKRYFGDTKWGHTPEESQQKFLEMMTGRLARCNKTIEEDTLPKYIKQRYLNIPEDQFGHSGWGLL